MQYVLKDQTYGQINFPDIELGDEVKGVLLDLDNTLYSYDKCHIHAIKMVINLLEKKHDIERNEFMSIYRLCRERVSADLLNQGASHSRILYFQKLTEILFSRTRFSLALKLEKLYWKEFFSELKLDVKAKKFLKECKEKKIKVCILTDFTARLQMKKIIKLDIESYIQYLVSSEEAGVEKPHPYMFKLGLEKLGLKENEVIMIGDNKKKDIAGANLLGIRSFFVGCE